MLKRRWILSFVGLVFLSTFAISVFSPFVRIAHAGVVVPDVPDSGTWIDKTRIIYNDNYYIDQNPFDGTRNYKATSSGTGTACGEINVKDDGSKANVNYKVMTSLGDCQNGEPSNKPDNISGNGEHNFDITLAKKELSEITAYRLDQKTIYMPLYLVQGGSFVTTYKDDTRENGFFKPFPQDASGYKPSLYIIQVGGKIGTYPFQDDTSEELSGEWLSTTENRQWGKLCQTAKCQTTSARIKLANSGNATQPPGIYGVTLNPDGSYNNPDDNVELDDSVTHVDCQTGGSLWNPLDNIIGWILCPLVDGAQGIVNTVGGWVVSQLEFDVDKYLTRPTENQNGDLVLPVKDAWNAFRVISLSLLIIIAMLGILLGGFMDAYTVKKILPRLLIAIIAISLSWDLVILAINITNAAGVWVRELIDSPFKLIDRPSISPLTILGAGGGASALTTILGLLSFVGTAALAVLFAFIFVILRVGAIIMLVIFAPLAILLWILPGTQKGWNFWQEGLTGALLMFPIVTAFLSIGAAFGKILYANDQGALGQVMALIATYAPYFLIPKAFSMAGGLVANLSGMVNDQGRGAFDRLKKFRQDQGTKRRHDIQGGQFFRGGKKHGFRQRVSGIAQGATLLPKAGLGKDVSMWAGKLDDARAVATQEHATKSMQERAAELARGKDDAIMKAKIASGGDLKKAEDYLASADGTADLYGGGKDENGNLHAKGSDAYNHNWEKNKGNREAALRVIDRMNRSYDQEAGDLIAFKTLVRSSTAFSDENGFGEMAEFIRKISTKPDGTVDALQATQLLEEGNAGQLAAGRNTVGGASFSVGIKAINNIGTRKINADGTISNEVYTSKDATHDAWASAIGGRPPDSVFVGGKVKNAKETANFLYGFTDKEGEVHQGEVQKRMDALNSNTTISESDRTIEATRILQWEESYHQAASRSSADIREVMGNAFAKPFDHNLLPQEMKEQIFFKLVPETDQSGKQITIDGPNGVQVPKMKKEYDSTVQLTRVEVFDRLRPTKYWNVFGKEYGLAAAAAGANPGAIVDPSSIDPGATQPPPQVP